VQQAAVTALAAATAGLRRSTRAPRRSCVAGIAFSGPQPARLHFQIITSPAALDAGLVKMSTRVSRQTKAVVDGVDLQNANGESCGGSSPRVRTFVQLRVRAARVHVGARSLVATESARLERAPTLAGALASTIPDALEISTRSRSGRLPSTRKVLPTPLQMASVAQRSRRGVRTIRHLPDQRRHRVRVTTRAVADKLEQLMIGVVAYGTGTRRVLAPVRWRARTGTAELTTTVEEGRRGAADQQGVDQRRRLRHRRMVHGVRPVRRPRIRCAC